MTTEQKVGLFFLAALIALGGMIELVEEWKPFEKQMDYRTYFDSAIGIKLGDPVRMAGVEVGKIRKISIQNNRVRIDFYVLNGTNVREDTIAEIRQTNLLGGDFLGLTFGSPSSPVLPEGSVVTSREGTNIDQLISNFDRNQERVLGALGDLIENSQKPFVDAIEKMDSIAVKIDEGEGTLGRLVNDPRLYDDLQKSVARLGSVLRKLENGEGTLGRLFTDPALYDDAAIAMANIKQISDSVREGKGTIGRLFNDDRLYAEVTETFANLSDISDKVNRGKGTFGKLLNDEELYEETREALSRLRSIAAKIDDGKGTLGRLVNDDDLYTDAKTTIKKVEKAVDGMRDTGPISALGTVVGTMF